MELPTPHSAPEPDTVILEVALRPGVTDPVAEQIVRAAHELGFDGVHHAATGQRFLITFNKSVREAIRESVKESVYKLFANPVIHHWTLGDITSSFPQETESSGAVEIISIRNLTDNELLSVSKDRRAALDLTEMKAIQNYFIKEQRDPTDVEFETIAQTWSEHCGHKTFKARVEVYKETSKQEDMGNLSTSLPVYMYTIDSIIKTYLKSATDKINAP
jgi:phosphoribosylformylglycinamidine synthase